jgi:hypothetical protein
MALTMLMFVVLIVSYALMFGLVRFTENIIAMPEYRAEPASADDGEVVSSGAVKNMPATW